MHPGLYKIQIGKETVAGTEVNATTYLRLNRGAFITDESATEFPQEDVGVMGGIGRNYVPMKSGFLTIPEMPLTFEQAPYFFNAGIKGVAGSQDGAGSDYIYTYPLPYSAAQAPYTYTTEAGDGQQAEILTGAFGETLTIKGASGQALMISGTWRGQPKGTTTFTSSLSIPTVEEPLFGNTKIYIDDVGDGFGTTQIEDSWFSFELQYNRIFEARWYGDGAGLYYTTIEMNSNYEVILKYSLVHNATSVAERANRRAGTPRAIRIIATGATVGTPGTTYSKKTMIFDIPGTYSEPSVMAEDTNRLVYPFTLKNHYEPTVDTRGQVIVVNELSALP